MSAGVGAVLTVVVTVFTSNHALNRIWAIQRAFASTSGRNKKLRKAIRVNFDELRPSAASSDELIRSLCETMGPAADNELTSRFVANLHKRFADRGMQIEWTAPVVRKEATATSTRNSATLPPGSRDLVGRDRELEQLRRLVSERANVAINGPPGIGKTSLLAQLARQTPDAVYVRLEQGGDPLRDLRIVLHRLCHGEFPVDDDQGIEAIARNLPSGVLLLVDNADEPKSANAVLRLVNHLPSLCVVVTSRGQNFPGFVVLQLTPLNDDQANALLEHLKVAETRRSQVVAKSQGNPLVLLQTANAADEGVDLDVDSRLDTVLGRLSNSEHRALWLIGDLPSAVVQAALLTEVGELSSGGLTLLRRNAVLKHVPPGFEAHETLRASCRTIARSASRDALAQLRSEVAEFYTRWLSTSPENMDIDAALPNLVYLLHALSEHERRVDLALAMIGDNLDDPNGYLPSVGLAGLLVEHASVLGEAAEKVGGARGARLEKNLGLFLYLANDGGARELLLSAQSRFQRVDDEEGRAAASWILGYIADDSSQYQSAERIYRAPLDWLTSRKSRATCHHLVACSLYHQGRFDDAMRELELAREMTDDPRILVRVERRVAYVELANGDVANAILKLEAARQRTTALSRPRDTARLARHLGVGLLQLGQIDRAESELEEARRSFEAIGDQRGLGSTLRNLATVRRMQGRLQEAAELADSSRQIAVGRAESLQAMVTSPYGVGAADEELASIAEASGDLAEMRSRLRSACNVFETIGHVRASLLSEKLGTCRNRQFPPNTTAVLFDLIDTLAFTESSKYEDVKVSIANDLGAEYERFKSAWSRSRHRASTDPDWTPADRIKWVARELGVPLADDLANTLALREEMLWSDSVRLKSDAIATLRSIKNAGFRIAIVSNGSSAMRSLPLQLDLNSVVDATIVSCNVRALKPQRGIYESALDALQVSADRCIYAGDGNDRELEGAMRAGIFSVKIVPHDQPRYDSSKSLNWDASCASLTEFLERLLEQNAT